MTVAVAGCTSNSIDPMDDAASMDSTASGTGGSSNTDATTQSVPPNPTTAGPMPTTSPPPPPMTTGAPDSGTLPTVTGFDTGDTDGMETLDTGDTGPVLVSFFADVAPIFQEVCAPSCHSPGGEWPVQDLQNTPYFALVDVPSQQAPMDKVEPGSLEMSYLWHKINGSHIDAGGAGQMMPKAHPMREPVELTEEQFDIIATWILDGAQNN